MLKASSGGKGRPYYKIAPSSCTSITLALHVWYLKNHRDLPWRKTADPYAIWISEVMLQQTQVKTVEPYYLRFMKQFPDVFSLARADLQAILKSWEGLGYYGRARNLHHAAGVIVSDMEGIFPDSWAAITRLPGVGVYIASAVLSIAFGKSYAVVDGNVKRVLARLFSLEWPVNKAASYPLFQQMADQLLDRKCPGDHNQGLMELGAMVCKPKQPRCANCPVLKYCSAFKADEVESYPVRMKRGPLPQRHIAVGVVEKRGSILLVQRNAPGLLGGLWEFPGGSIARDDDPGSACERGILSTMNLHVTAEAHLVTVHHTYTHFKLRMDVYRCRWHSGRVYLRGPADFKWIKPSRVNSFPLHGAMHKAVANCRSIFS